MNNSHDKGGLKWLDSPVFPGSSITFEGDDIRPSGRYRYKGNRVEMVFLWKRLTSDVEEGTLNI
jgi:hypothetical protein